MKSLIEKYYNWIFPQDDEKQLSFGAKTFLFCITLALSGLILFVLVRDIFRNLQAH